MSLVGIAVEEALYYQAPLSLYLTNLYHYHYIYLIDFMYLPYV